MDPSTCEPEELRIALVMNGGVSLAVWIGGATCEFARLVAAGQAQADDIRSSRSNPYAALLDLVKVEPRIDVIAGTSAGGVNGAYLALSLAKLSGDRLARQMDSLRELWIADGAIDDLLRDPAIPKVPSLLDGDGYYYEKLRDAFAAIDDGARKLSDPSDVPIELILTSTLLKGQAQNLADDFGSSLADVSHRAHFHFSRAATAKGAARQDHFESRLIADQLAVAARSTSSFPGAFEPSFCPIRDQPDPEAGDAGMHDCGRPYMDGIASFEKSRFLIDGGVLDNKPLDVALDCIVRLRASRPARRVLAYVVPDPGQVPSADHADAPSDMPGFFPVLLSSALEIPSVQSVSNEVRQLRDHNETVRRMRRARSLATRYIEPADLDGIARSFFDAYRDARAERALDDIIDGLNQGLSKHPGRRALGKAGRKSWLRAKIYQYRDDIDWIPNRFPLDQALGQILDGWDWGSRPLEHLARLAYDLLVRIETIGRETIFGEQPEGQAHRDWSTISTILANVRAIRSAEADFWQQRETIDELVRHLDEGDALSLERADDGGWFLALLNRWRQVQRPREAAIAARIAEFVLGLGLAWRHDLRRHVGREDPASAERDLKRLLGYFVRDDERAADRDARSRVLGRLLTFSIVEHTLAQDQDLAEEEIEFIQISGDDDELIGGRLKAADKLNGTQLAHFGGFYKSSWRANDWQWGRRDAVPRILRLLLDPKRLETVARRADRNAPVAWLMKRIEAIVMGFASLVGASGDDVPMLQQLWADHRMAVSRELGFVASHDPILPESLPVLTSLLSQCFEIDILRREIPTVANQILFDKDAKMRIGRAAQQVSSYCRNLRPGEYPPADTVRSLVVRRDPVLGSETWRQEVGTDQATYIVAKAVAVGVATLRGEKGSEALLGKLVAALRVPSLVFYGIARNLLLASSTAVAVNTALTIAAIAILIMKIFAKMSIPTPLVAASVAVLIAMLATLMMSKWRWWLRYPLGGLAGAGLSAGAWYLHHRFGSVLSTRTGKLALGEGAIIGGAILWKAVGYGARIRAWRQRRRRLKESRQARANAATGILSRAFARLTGWMRHPRPQGDSTSDGSSA